MSRSRAKASGAESKEGYLQIGRSARFDGQIRGGGLAMVHGRVSGSIELSGDLIVAADGRVSGLKGAVVRLRVEGNADGSLKVASAVEVAATGLLEGEIEALRLEAIPGARIEAQLRIAPPGGPSDSHGA